MLRQVVRSGQQVDLPIGPDGEYRIDQVTLSNDGQYFTLAIFEAAAEQGMHSQKDADVEYYDIRAQTFNTFQGYGKDHGYTFVCPVGGYTIIMPKKSGRGVSVIRAGPIRLPEEDTSTPPAQILR